MSQAPAIYRLAHLRHRYGPRVVLDIDQLEVMRGETLAVIGPSGSGKTTLLRLLQGLETASEGEVRFEDQRLGRDAPAQLKRHITTVFQRPLMLDGSVGDNVGYGLRLRGDPERRQKVAEWLGAIGLSELAGQRARSLSGGELQRVAVARAFALGTRVLLLDEPTANLDPSHVALIERLIRQRREAGVTVVVVTHHVFQARRLADRTALLVGGHLAEVGPTTELLQSPRDERTKAFLNGEMIY